MSLSRNERDLRRDDVLTSIQSLLVVVVVAAFVVTFIVQPFRIPSESMDPTLRVGDFLLMNKQTLAPHGPLDALLPHQPVRRGEVVVFHYPIDPSKELIKRVVGLPGDRLHLHGGQLFVNGEPLVEPWARYTAALPEAFRDDFPALHAMDQNVDPAWWAALRLNVRNAELYVPAGQYFVLGDNRNNSEDSRYWGFVPEKALVGRPIAVYFSVPPASEASTWRQRLASSFHNIRRVQ